MVAQQGQALLIAQGDLEAKSAYSEHPRRFFITSIYLKNLGPSHLMVTDIGFSHYLVPKSVDVAPGDDGLLFSGEMGRELYDAIRGNLNGAEAHDEFFREVENGKVQHRTLTVQCLSDHGPHLLEWRFEGSPTDPIPLRLQDAPLPLEQQTRRVSW